MKHCHAELMTAPFFNASYSSPTLWHFQEFIIALLQNTFSSSTLFKTNSCTFADYAMGRLIQIKSVFLQVQEEVRQLLCVLTRDNSSATAQLCRLLMERIVLNLHGNVNGSDLGVAIRHEMALLAAMVQKDDECWELKLRCLVQLFLLACNDSKNPLVMESVILPCLKILYNLMKAPEGANKKAKVRCFLKN